MPLAEMQRMLRKKQARDRNGNQGCVHVKFEMPAKFPSRNVK